jgi:hypothetical protein
LYNRSYIGQIGTRTELTGQLLVHTHIHNFIGICQQRNLRKCPNYALNSWSSCKERLGTRLAALQPTNLADRCRLIDRPISSTVRPAPLVYRAVSETTANDICCCSSLVWRISGRRFMYHVRTFTAAHSHCLFNDAVCSSDCTSSNT